MSEPMPPSGEGAARYNLGYLNVTGVRFHPTDQELITHYLQRKLRGEPPLYADAVNDNDDDVYSEHPKDLMRKLGKGFEGSWYLFSPRDRKYAGGERPRRGTDDEVGFWKSMVSRKDIFGGADGKEVIGYKCGLTYHVFVGKPGDNAKTAAERERKRKAKSKPTEWRMLEFVSVNTDRPPDKTAANNMLLNDYVLCKITNKKLLAVENDPGSPQRTEVEQGAPSSDGSGVLQYQQHQSTPSEGPAGPHDEQQHGYPFETADIAGESQPAEQHEATPETKNKAVTAAGLPDWEPQFSSLLESFNLSNTDELPDFDFDY